MNVRIYRNDAVALRLHVGGHSVAGTQRAVGETHHGDGAGALEQVSDRIGLRQGSHAAIVVLRGKASPVKNHVGTAPRLSGGAKLRVFDRAVSGKLKNLSSFTRPDSRGRLSPRDSLALAVSVHLLLEHLGGQLADRV